MMDEVTRPLLPYALAFAAGAMIFVVVEEVFPSPGAAAMPTRRPWGSWWDSR
jgi:zinc transporter ZupT